MALVLVDTLAELRETVTTWGNREADDDMEACCCFDYDAPGREYGFVIFAREKLSRALLVHECTHAALAFVGAEVMTSEAVNAMAEDDQAEYYDEACARVCEHLFEQAERLLWPCPASVKGGALASAPGSALARRFRYNCETNARFGDLKCRLSTALRFEEKGAWREAAQELEKLACEVNKLRLHLEAWENYKPNNQTDQ